MTKFILLAVSLCLFLLVVASADASDQEMRLDAFICPTGSVVKKEVSAGGTSKWTTEYPPVREWNGEKIGDDAFDLVPFFIKNGVSFPKGSEAVFFPERNVLLVRHTKEGLDLIRDLVGAVRLVDQAILIRTEFLLISFSAEGDDVGHDAISYDELRKLSGTSWGELARFQIVSKSGERTNSRQNWTNESLAKSETSLSEIICQVECEAIIGPDGNLLDLEISFRSHGAGANASKSLDVEYKGSTTVSSEEPQILQLYMSDDPKTRVALVVRSSVVRPDMRSLR